MADKLSALFENREYFFTFLKRRSADRATNAPEEIEIDMYGTLYGFIKHDGKWVNRPGNKMNMNNGLIESVVLVLHNLEQQ